jgi:AraC-like DNA-binding protein
MITTSEVAPSPVLAPFVRCYSYIEFDTGGIDFIRPTNAVHEMAMTFHFKAKPIRFINPDVIQTFENTYGGVIGLFTQNNGRMVFNGHYIFFEIMFRPNGFYKIFRLPPAEINNQMIFADEIFESGVKAFYERLCIAGNSIDKMCVLADAYLSGYLKKQKSVDYKDGITRISNFMLRNAGLVNIDRLAADANMSVRTFERHFVDQVGLSPKLFCSITRFNRALALRLKYPKLDWTSIALTCGYYDQTHLIKDFKTFSGHTPSVFQKETHLAKVDFTNQVEP